MYVARLGQSDLVAAITIELPRHIGKLYPLRGGKANFHAYNRNMLKNMTFFVQLRAFAKCHVSGNIDQSI